MTEWHPISDLPDNHPDLAEPDLVGLGNLWRDRVKDMRETPAYQAFMGRLRRRFAIETGVIERLYTIDRGITQVLIERGIDESLIQHGTTDLPAHEVIALVRDQDEAIQSVFDYVGQQMPLSTFYIKQLHQILTRHQDEVDAQDQFGRRFKTKLLKGEWKQLANNPTRRSGKVHEYCPPLQVAPQMEQLIAWHKEHLERGIVPEVEAAWLHHRFTQIHPFQDGNGRVARLLATLVFVRAHWFLLVVTSDERDVYIDALEAADKGDLKPLVSLFARTQRQAFISALALSEDVVREQGSLQSAIDAFAKSIHQRQMEQTQQLLNMASNLHHRALQQIGQFQQELEAILKQSQIEVQIAVKDAPHGNATDYYYRWQIIETAKMLDYFANLEGYRSWIRLRIQLSSLRIEAIFAAHGMGKNAGLMAWSACIYEMSDNNIASSLEALPRSPFQFNQYDQQASLEKRFKEWLDHALIAALAYLRARI